MSSSTTIQGASIRSAKKRRAPADRPTIAASHAHAGTARTSERAGEPVTALTAKADLAERRADSLCVLEPDVGGALCEPAEQLLSYGRTAGSLFRRAHVEVGDAVEVVLARREAAGRRTERFAASRIVGEQEERRRERRRLALVRRDLEDDVVGELGKRVDVTDDQGLGEREDTDHAGGGLAHRRPAQRDGDVTGGEERPEARLVDVAVPLDRVLEPERGDPSFELEPRRLGADEQEARARVACAQDRERLEELRDALVRVQEAEAADHRVTVYRRGLGGRRRPDRHRDRPDRPVEARRTRAPADVLGVDNQAVLACEVEHLACEREVLRSGRPERRDAAVDDAEGEQAAGETGVALHRVQVAGDVHAREREARDEVVE